MSRISALLVLAVAIAAAQAGHLGYHGYEAAPVHHVEIGAPAHYDFGYDVNDPHTGDSKTRRESRRGDVVHGSYSVVEADGTRRIVEYTADPLHGFNAVVHKEPAVVAVAPAPVAYEAPAFAYGANLAHGYAGPWQ